MGSQENARRGALVLALAAGIWPSALCLLSHLAAAPYERVLSAAICGAGPLSHEFLGHCAACWGGSAALLAAASVLLFCRSAALPAALSAP